MTGNPANHNAICLSEITETGIYLVTKVEGSDPELRRLNQIGLMPGMRMELLLCPQDGMMVSRAAGGKLAMARATTGNVWVRFRKPL